MILTKRYDIEERRRLIFTCMGLDKPDLTLTRGLIIDVATSEVRRADIVIKGGRIAYVGDVKDLRISHLGVVIDVNDKFITPGFIYP
ncbi:MAG: hypothetical protein QXW83_02445, partial [Nitrososphaerales archaeon]